MEFNWKKSYWCLKTKNGYKGLPYYDNEIGSRVVFRRDYLEATGMSKAQFQHTYKYRKLKNIVGVGAKSKIMCPLEDIIVFSEYGAVPWRNEIKEICGVKVKVWENVFSKERYIIFSDLLRSLGYCRGYKSDTQFVLVIKQNFGVKRKDVNFNVPGNGSAWLGKEQDVINFLSSVEGKTTIEYCTKKANFRRDQNTNGFLYIFNNEMGCLKIGKTIELNSRLSDYQTLYDHRVSFIKTIKVNNRNKAEKLIHKQLAKWKVKGGGAELFKLESLNTAIFCLDCIEYSNI